MKHALLISLLGLVALFISGCSSTGGEGVCPITGARGPRPAGMEAAAKKQDCCKAKADKKIACENKTKCDAKTACDAVKGCPMQAQNCPTKKCETGKATCDASKKADCCKVKCDAAKPAESKAEAPAADANSTKPAEAATTAEGTAAPACCTTHKAV